MKKTALFFLVSCLVWPSVNAAVLYRYKDEAGNIVMARTIPTHLVPNGYEVLNEKGRVIEKVAAALTEKQKEERDARLALKKREAEALAKQQEEDRRLLKQYSHPDDAVRILTRRLADIDAVLRSQEGAIEVAEKTIRALEEKAADYQRNGRAVPKYIQDQIKNAEHDVVRARRRIEEEKEDRKKIIVEFDLVIKRLEFLTKEAASPYPRPHS